MARGEGTSSCSAATGKLDGERSRPLPVNDVLIARKAVVIATGCAAACRPSTGCARRKPWTNREATTAKEVPESLVVLGGGPVGVEMAQAWSHARCRTSLLVERPPNRCRRSRSRSPASRWRTVLQRGWGGRPHRRTKVDERSRVDTAASPWSWGRAASRSGAARFLVAIGRRPRLTLGSRRRTETRFPFDPDDRLRVEGSDWLYAVEDVNGRALLTHMGKYQARICRGRDPRAWLTGVGDREGQGVPARHLHRAASGRRRIDPREGARRPPWDRCPCGGRGPPRWDRGGELHRQGKRAGERRGSWWTRSPGA